VIKIRCIGCVASRSDEGYEHSATEWWCAVGKETIEFADGGLGCHRRSVGKLQKDIKIQSKIESKAFAEECVRMFEFFEREGMWNGEM